MRDHVVRRRRGLFTLCAVLVGLLLWGGVAPVDAAPGPVLTVQQTAVKNAINKDRKAKRLRLLTTHPSAQVKAQALANKLAKEQRLVHSPSLTSGIKPCFLTVGENIGRGSSVADVQRRFMASKIHRDNILSVNGVVAGKVVNRNWNSVGVGYAVGKDRKVYVVQIFVLTRKC